MRPSTVSRSSPNPGPDWPTVVGALIDGIELVVVGSPGAVPEGVVKSLQARARQRGCVLVPVSAWPNADVVLELTSRRWEGLRHGRGRLRRQYLEVTATGRGRAARRKTAEVLIGEPVREVRIPAPPPGLFDRPFTKPKLAAAPDPWARVAPNGEPDLWGPLLHELPPMQRRPR